MTVLYISPPARLGGGEISLLTLVSHLPRDRYRPLVVTCEDGELVGRMRGLGVEVEILRRGPGLILRLARLIRQRDVALVHVNTFDLRAALAARLTGVPLVGHLRVIFPFRWPDRLFVRLCDRTVAVSDAARDHFCREAPGLRERFTTIYNAVSLPDPPKVSDLRAELGLSSGTPLVGAVARIDPWKGLDVFVRAAGLIRAHSPDVRFVIAGRPGESPEEIAHEKNLRRLAHDLGLESDLFFLGFRPDGVEVIRQLDLLLVPSLILKAPGGPKSEGFGRVAAEALSVGTPVVAARAGGIPEVLGHGEAGVLVPPGDADALAGAALSLLRDEARRLTLARRGRRRFEECFTVERHVQQIVKVYEEVLKQRGTQNAER